MIDESQRPVVDVTGNRISFALAGTAVRLGDPVRLRIAGPPSCPTEFGPELNWIAEDRDAPLHIVDTDKGWVYERTSALELVSAHTTWTSYPSAGRMHVAVPSDRGGWRPRCVVQPVGDGTFGTAVVDSFSLTVNRVRRSRGVQTKRRVVDLVLDERRPRLAGAPIGRSVPIVVADGALMAIEVEPGNHHIELDYRPRSFRAGVAVTFLTIAGLTVFLWLDRRAAPYSPQT